MSSRSGSSRGSRSDSSSSFVETPMHEEIMKAADDIWLSESELVDLSNSTGQEYERVKRKVDIILNLSKEKRIAFNEAISRFNDMQVEIREFSITKRKKLQELMLLHRGNIQKLKDIYAKHNLKLKNLVPSVGDRIREEFILQFKDSTEHNLSAMQKIISEILKSIQTSRTSPNAQNVQNVQNTQNTQSSGSHQSPVASNVADEGRRQTTLAEEVEKETRSRAVDIKRKELLRNLRKAEKGSELSSRLEKMHMLNDEDFATKNRL